MACLKLRLAAEHALRDTGRHDLKLTRLRLGTPSRVRLMILTEQLYFTDTIDVNYTGTRLLAPSLHRLCHLVCSTLVSSHPLGVLQLSLILHNLILNLGDALAYFGSLLEVDLVVDYFDQVVAHLIRLEHLDEVSQLDVSDWLGVRIIIARLDVLHDLVGKLIILRKT